MQKYISALLTLLIFFILTYVSAPDEFNNLDLIIIILLLILFWLLLFIIVFLFKFFVKTDHWIINFIFSGLLLIGIYSLNLSLNNYFISLLFWQKSVYFIVGFFIIFTMMKFFDEGKKASVFLNGILALVAVGILSTLAFDRAPLWFDKTALWFNSPKAGKTSSKNINLVTFNQKPNVYLISFDSLQPRKLVKKYLGIDGSAYHDILDEKFFPFKNFFADRVPTRQSLNSLLALDIKHYDSLYKQTRYGFFQGKVSGPLFEIFKHNNYVTNTLYLSEYFGIEKGPFVDNYHRNESKGACEFIEENLKPFVFFGHCKINKNQILTWFGMMPLSNSQAVSQDEFVISKMKEGLSASMPQVLLAYIYLPGHVEKGFNYDNSKMLSDYRQFYEMRSKLTKKVIERLMDFIDKDDPNAILYVFGDHGPYLSKGKKFSKDAEFFIQDRYGVYGGIYPKNRCKNEFSKHDGESFMTVSKVMVNLLDCLTDDEVLSEPLQYILPVEENYKYEQYLYE